MSIFKGHHHVEKHLKGNIKYLGDLVFGANDGIITTFAIISGSAGASLSSTIIIILGLSNILADGISMGFSNYLALRSQKDYEIQERGREIYEVENFPEEEKKEVKAIFKRWGITDESDLERLTTSATKDHKKWVDLMMIEELGIIESDIQFPWKHGFVTFLAFIAAGSMPLIPYFFSISQSNQFSTSILSTAASLFIVGSMRSLVTKIHWLKSGLQMLFVGSLAAGSAYLVGFLIKTVFNISI